MNYKYAESIILIILSLIGFILEFISIINPSVKIIGTTGQLLYLYIFIILSGLYISSFVYQLENSSKFYSYKLVASIIGIIGSILNVLIIFSHILYTLPPISDSTNSLSIINEFSLIIIIGIFSFKFLYKEKLIRFNLFKR